MEIDEWSWYEVEMVSYIDWLITWLGMYTNQCWLIRVLPPPPPPQPPSPSPSPWWLLSSSHLSIHPPLSSTSTPHTAQIGTMYGHRRRRHHRRHHHYCPEFIHLSIPHSISIRHIHWVGYCFFIQQPCSLAFIPQVASKSWTGMLRQL